MNYKLSVFKKHRGMKINILNTGFNVYFSLYIKYICIQILYLQENIFHSHYIILKVSAGATFGHCNIHIFHNDEPFCCIV